MATPKIWARLRRLWAALDGVAWDCHYCQHPHWTSLLIWRQLRYQLICDHCHYQQNYPEWIRPQDPYGDT